MELVGGLFQPVLGACSVPKPKAGLVDWAGAPKDRKMNAAVLTEYGREVKHKHIDLPTELVRATKATTPTYLPTYLPTPQPPTALASQLLRRPRTSSQAKEIALEFACWQQCL